ncbi:uncharacterized protein BXZ73DRAFT_82997 [Epithele typhae]|uniref:uncharacterized protein n=1 Tax=Epithele typhae TaxID=378194 RepID=UPI0020086657|nr:uncharacterized protein BXZ73DRAFT_82997 [Epithele typhae]KAH9911054.1 hypothetical protein BXZ73DRAFT_82997 [Epithele typhae]
MAVHSVIEPQSTPILSSPSAPAADVRGNDGARCGSPPSSHRSSSTSFSLSTSSEGASTWDLRKALSNDPLRDPRCFATGFSRCKIVFNPGSNTEFFAHCTPSGRGPLTVADVLNCIAKKLAERCNRLFEDEPVGARAGGAAIRKAVPMIPRPLGCTHTSSYHPADPLLRQSHPHTWSEISIDLDGREPPAVQIVRTASDRGFQVRSYKPLWTSILCAPPRPGCATQGPTSRRCTSAEERTRGRVCACAHSTFVCIFFGPSASLFGFGELGPRRKAAAGSVRTVLPGARK